MVRRFFGMAGYRLGGSNTKAIVGILAALLVVVVAVVVIMRGREPGGGQPGMEIASNAVVAVEALPALPGGTVEPAVAEPTPEPTVETAPEADAGHGGIAQDANSGLVLKGVVVAADGGAGVAGARISGMGRTVMRFMGGEIPDAEFLGETGADGRFEIPWTLGIPQMPQGQNFIAIVVEAPGFATSMSAINTTVARKEEIRIELKKGGTITGRVVAKEGGAGIAEAKLIAAPNGMPMGGMQADSAVAMSYSIANGVSDASGNFVLQGTEESSTYSVLAKAKNFVATTKEGVKPGMEALVIELEAGDRVIRGRVLEPDGAPVAGASVMANAQMGILGGGVNMLMGPASTATTSDAQGAFEIASIGPGQYVVVAMEMGPKGIPKRQINQTVDLTTEKVAEVELRFPKPVSITGIALEDTTGAPLAGVKVSTSNFSEGAPANREAPVATSGIDGTFTLDQVTMQGQSIAIYSLPPTGYLKAPDLRNWGDQVHLQIPDPSIPPKVELRFAKGVTVNGVVLKDDEATPAAGAEVTMQRERGSATSVNTDSEGRFVLLGLPGYQANVFAALAGFGTDRMDVVIPSTGEPDEVRLILKKNAAISGTVRGPAGEPVEGVFVMAGVTLMSGQMTTFNGGRVATGKDGSYYLENVPHGQAKIHASLDQHNDRGSPLWENLKKYTQPPVQTLDLKPGEYRRPVDFVLDEGLTLTGTVKNEKGEPIANASVNPNVYSQSAWVDRNTTTDAEGKFTIVSLQETTVINNLSISHEDYDPISRENLTIASGPLEIVIKPRGSATIRVVRADGSAPASVLYREVYQQGYGILRPSGQPSTQVLEAGGLLLMKGVTSGDHTYQIVESGTDVTGDVGVVTIKVEQGKEAPEAAVTLGPRGVLVGRVVSGEGDEAVAMASVGLYRKRGQWDNIPTHAAFDPANVYTSAEGMFALSGVIPGDYHLSAAKDGLDQPAEDQNTEKSAAVAGRESAQITLRLGSKASVFGRIIGRDGKPATTARISYYGNNDAPRSATAGAEGEYELTNIATGRASIIVTLADANFTKSESLQLKPGERIEKNFDFSGEIAFTAIIKSSGPNGLTALAADNNVTFSAMPTNPTAGETASRTAFSNRGEAGRFTGLLAPGRYRLMMSRRVGNMFPEPVRVGDFEITSTPDAQEKEFVIALCAVSVALVYPVGQDPVVGDVLLAPVATNTEQLYRLTAKQTVSRESATFVNVAAGRYKASFRSPDGKWQGTSEEADVQAGAENILVIEVADNAGRQRLGSWAETEKRDAVHAVEFDATAIITSAGFWQVLFDYENGAEGLQIERVALKMNGGEIATDSHIGWSGYTRRDHIYRLAVPAFEPGARFTVVAYIKAAGVSNGGVWMQKQQ